MFNPRIFPEAFRKLYHTRCDYILLRSWVKVIRRARSNVRRHIDAYWRVLSSFSLFDSLWRELISNKLISLEFHHIFSRVTLGSKLSHRSVCTVECNPIRRSILGKSFRESSVGITYRYGGNQERWMTITIGKERMEDGGRGPCWARKCQ